MAKKRLQPAKVGPAIEHVGGEAVPDDMRADPPRIEPGRRGELFQRASELLA